MVSISPEITFAIFSLLFGVSVFAVSTILYALTQGDPMTAEMGVALGYGSTMVTVGGWGMWKNRRGF